MKLLRRLLFVVMPFGAVAFAQATQWNYLTSARDLSYAVDNDSVKTTPDGYIEYVAKTTWKTAAMLPGATAPVAVSLTRYQIDCGKKQWRTLDTRYKAASGASAGTFNTNDDWSDIGPGTVVDVMYRKVC